VSSPTLWVPAPGIVDDFSIESVAPESDRGVDIGRHQVRVVQVDHAADLLSQDVVELIGLQVKA
jgi:hypothetical protein